MTNIVLLIGPDRYRLTRQCLDSLLAHTETGSYNLTIVLDDPDFRINMLVRSITAAFPASVTAIRISNSGHTLSQLKNLGVAWSDQRWGRGDGSGWLYISDSDVWFSEGWLEKLTSTAEFAESFKFRLFGGQVHPFHSPVGELIPITGQWVDNSHPAHRAVAWTEHSVLDGPSWLMRWSTWDQYGPFDRTTAPGVCQSEEYPFCERLTKPRQLITGDGGGGLRHIDGPGSRIGVISPHVVVHCGLTHLDGHDCVGRREREAMIPAGVLAE